MSGFGAPPWLYRQLLRLLPADLRKQFGAEIGWMFTERLRTAPGRIVRLRIWVSGVADVVRHAMAARGRAGRRSQPTDTGRAGLLAGTLRQDVRTGLRGLRRSPGFALASVITLALGVGVVTAVFGVVNALMLRPLPYRAAERLVDVWPDRTFNTALLAQVEADVPALEAVSGMSLWTLTLVETGAEPLELEGMFVSPGHFDMLGVRAALGRTFRPEEGEPGRGDVVMLGWDFWQMRYGGDPAVLGRRIELSGGEHDSRVVIGVLPAEHRPVWRDAAVWVPLERRSGVTLATDNSWWINRRVGRLAPGATIEDARLQVQRVARAARSEVSSIIDEASVREARVMSLEDTRVDQRIRTALLVLLCAVALVLLIACVNIANLLLARGVTRQTEIALRRALGASRARVGRQLLVETGLLALAGGAGGVALAALLVRALSIMAPAELSGLASIRLDPPLLAFALLLSCGSGLLAGVLPALRSGGPDSAGLMRSGGRPATESRATGRLSRGLVAVEVALAMVLVAASGLMLRSLTNLRSVDTGFSPAGVLSFRPGINGSRYPDAAAYRRYYDEVIARVGALPSVASVAGVQILPVTYDNWSFPLYIEGHPVPTGGSPPTHNYRVVTPGYVETMEMELIAGRDLLVTDREGSPLVGLVNRAFARMYWPDGSAVGRELRLFSPRARPVRIVGVVNDIHQRSLDAEPAPELYVPHAQVPWETSLYVLARSRDGDAEALAPAVREAVWSVDRDVPIARMEPLSRVVDRSAATTQFLTLLLSGFGLLALALGAVGVYGVTAFFVARRLPEYGIRLAMGATPRAVAGEALMRGGIPVLLGLVAGGVGTIAATRMLQGLLFGVAPGDAVTLVATTGVLAAVALLALIQPVRRATRADPVALLRGE